MNDILFAVYSALACLFAALTLAALPGMSPRLDKGERAGWYGVVSGAAATLTCVLIALAPMVGRGLLGLSVPFLWLSVLAAALRVRSWHRGLNPVLEKRSMLLLAVAGVLMLVQFFNVDHRPARAALQASVSVVLLGWLLLEIVRTHRQERSLQLVLMGLASLSILLLIVLWSGLIFARQTGRLVEVSAMMSEDYLTFVMRFFIMTGLALLLISANGFGLARMIRLKLAVSAEKAQTDAFNDQLVRMLSEKNEMMQTLTFAARSENLPTILASLSHEINQPLGAIRLNADCLLAEDLVLAPQDRAQMLRQLVAGSEAASQVVRDFRRLMAASPTLHETQDLAQVIADLVRTLQVELTRQDVQVIFKTQAVQVRGDRLQLQTAVGGILFFLVQRERQQPLQVLMSTKPSGRFVALGVLDDGPPLTETLYTQALDHMNTGMHSPFSRSLWLSRAIVEHHGGTMRLHEEDGQTGIQVLLPIWEKDQ